MDALIMYLISAFIWFLSIIISYRAGVQQGFENARAFQRRKQRENRCRAMLNDWK